MALVVGQAHTDPVTGLAGRIYTNWTGAADAGLSIPLSVDQRKMFAAQCEAIAKAVVDEIQANATVLIQPTDAGLQRSTAVGAATSAPAATVTLPGGAVK
jgi:hypothetical protein